jgi:phosphatidylglycerophosphate synthase
LGEEKRLYTMEDVKASFKERDAWWTVLLVDPIAARLILTVANRTRITPNQLSIASFIVGMTAALCFYLGNYLALVIGALLYHISFIIDCMDGKIARMKGTGTSFGILLDISLDHVRVALCGIALTFGQFRLTDDVTYLYLLPLFLVAYFARHINALQLYKLRREMQKKLSEAKEELKQRLEAAGVKEGQGRKYLKETHGLDPADDGSKTDLQLNFKTKFRAFTRIREFFLAKRIRMHFFSGIEFQMFIFIVAPVLGIIKETILFGSILLFAFEAAILYKIWLSTKDFEREYRKIRTAAESLDEAGKESAEGAKQTG